MLPLNKICAEIGDDLAAELCGDGSVSLERISTDTRSLKAGDVFVALRGPNHDGHDHIDAAIAAGASAFIAESDINSVVPYIKVNDSRLALGRLAQLWNQNMPAQRVAVTGSNGKTTVKEMIAAILAEAASETGVLATRGNFNNDIGLPLTCLEIRPHHRYAVLEMGASAGGEISYLSDLARPAAAVVTSIAAAHLEGFGSIEEIAREKASIFSGLDESGVAAFPADSPYINELSSASSHCRRIKFGFVTDADVVGSDGEAAFASASAVETESTKKVASQTTRVKIDPQLDSQLAGADFTISLQLLGQHNRLNALAAIAVCCALDVSVENIVKGLAAVQSVPGRLQLRFGLPSRVIDDTYNANPASLRAAIDLLAGYGGKRVLVLGDMKELGADELQLHADAGRYARQAGIDCLICVGDLAAHAAGEFGENAASFTDKTEVADLLRRRLGVEHTVLFKGSRGARMEEIIELLLQAQSVKREQNPPSGGGSQSNEEGVSAASSVTAKTQPPTKSSEFRQDQSLGGAGPAAAQYGFSRKVAIT